MSRPWVLVCLLLLIVFTSQFEWKQQYGNELEASSITSQKQNYISEREEAVKEKEELRTLLKLNLLSQILNFLEMQKREASRLFELMATVPLDSCSIWQIILSQEKNIQKLNEIVQSLREELLHCRGGSEVVNSTATHLTELLTELEHHPILED